MIDMEKETDMARIRVAIAAGIAGLGAFAAIPTAALAHDRVVREYRSYSYESDRDDDYDHDRREYRRYDDGYYEEPVEYRRSAYYEERPRYERRYREDRASCRSNGTTGAIIGGAIGALLGRGIDSRGDRTTGTILGAGGGAVVGHEIDSNRRC